MTKKILSALLILAVVLTVSGRGDKDINTYPDNKQMAGEYANNL